MEFIKRRLESLIDGVIVAAIIAVGVAVWSLVSKLPPPIIFVAAMATFAAIIIIWNQLGIWRERTKKKLSKYSEKELETVIREWVDIPSLSFRRQEPEQTRYFKFLLTDNFNRYVTIIREKSEPSMILILSEMTFPDDKQQLTQANWETLADRLSLELARLGIQFTFNGIPNQLQRIRVTEPVIIDDSLTGFHFRQRVIFVIRALVLAQQVGKDTFKELGITLPVSHKEGS